MANLALACHRCNERHYNFTTGRDPETQQEVTLFHPRQQRWHEHFVWTADGLQIIGVSPTGRATCARLDLNDERHDAGFIQEARSYWRLLGFHPPEDDPQQPLNLDN